MAQTIFTGLNVLAFCALTLAIYMNTITRQRQEDFRFVTSEMKQAIYAIFSDGMPLLAENMKNGQSIDIQKYHHFLVNPLNSLLIYFPSFKDKDGYKNADAKLTKLQAELNKNNSYRLNTNEYNELNDAMVAALNDLNSIASAEFERELK